MVIPALRLPRRWRSVRAASDSPPGAVSKANRVANSFLGWYLAGSLAWIFGSDALLRFLERLGPMPPELHTIKGFGYVLVLGLVLRRAAKVYVSNVEKAHAAQIAAKLELVGRLALASEYRDDQTGGHNYRIGRYAQILAREVGVDERSCEILFHAATLHDLGKIGISDSILLKEGPLTPDERAAMERHALLGADLLADGHHPLVVMAHAVALTHHERWDGKGYPQRLREHEIPLEGRIVAVCDVFDALTTDRPYKTAWPIEEAVAEIVRGRGTHFDPDVVDTFVRCLDEIGDVHAEREPRPWGGFRSDLVARSGLT